MKSTISGLFTRDFSHTEQTQLFFVSVVTNCFDFMLRRYSPNVKIVSRRWLLNTFEGFSFTCPNFHFTFFANWRPMSCHQKHCLIFEFEEHKHYEVLALDLSSLLLRRTFFSRGLSLMRSCFNDLTSPFSSVIVFYNSPKLGCSNVILIMESSISRMVSFITFRAVSSI